MKAKEIINILNSFADPKLIDSWDNTGFQIGNYETEISKILVSLDLDETIVNKAISEGYQMIVTHHPLIFKPLKDINSSSYLGRLIMKLISNDIAVYSAHSNLDLAYGGVNDELASVLGLNNTKPLTELIIDEKLYGYGRVGTVDEIETIVFLNKLKINLSVEDIRVYGDINKKVSRIAVCGGSGGDFILDAYKMGAEVFITGDIKYHEAQMALQLGLIVVDAGHFHTEKIILPKIKEIILKDIRENIIIEVIQETTVSYELY